MENIALTNCNSKVLKFKSLKIPMNSITLLLGDNSSGKSFLLESIIQDYGNKIFLKHCPNTNSYLESMSPSLFSVSINEECNKVNIAQFLNLHAAIISMFIEQSYENKLVTIPEICKAVFEEKPLPSKIFVKVKTTKYKDLYDAFDFVSGISIYEDIEKNKKIEDFSYQENKILYLQLPKSSLTSLFSLSQDLKIISKFSEMHSVVVKKRGSLKEYTLNSKATIKKSETKLCDNCKGKGIVFSPDLRIEEAVTLKIKQIEKFLETISGQGHIPNDQYILFLGICERLKIKPNDQIYNLNSEQYKEIVENNTNDADFKWVGLKHLLDTAYSSNINSNTRQKTFFSNKPCVSCCGSGLFLNQEKKLNGYTICQMFSIGIAELEPIIKSLPSLYHNTKKHLERLIYVCFKLGLEHIPINKTMESLSYGETKKIKLAKAFLYNISGCVFICDNISVGMDEQSIVSSFYILKKIAQNGNCIITSSSREESLLIDLSDNILHIGNGKITQVDKQKIKQKIEKDIYAPEKVKECKTFCISNFPTETISRSMKSMSIFGKSGIGKTSFINKNIIPFLVKNLNVGYGSQFYLKQTLASKNPNNEKSVIEILDVFKNIIKRVPRYKSKEVSYSSFIKDNRCFSCDGKGKNTINILDSKIKTPCLHCKGSGWEYSIKNFEVAGICFREIFEMTAKELCAFLKDINMNHSSKKLETLVNIGGGDIKINSVYKNLSSGMQKIISLTLVLNKAKSFIGEQSFMILDEPTNYLTFEKSFLLKKEIENIKNKKNVIIISVHSFKDKFLEEDTNIMVI